jgi:hypothetical protein
LNTEEQKQRETGAPFSGDCEEGCNAGGVRLLSVSGDGEESCNAGVGSLLSVNNRWFGDQLFSCRDENRADP